VLPALAQQEAIFVGEGAAPPARIRVKDLLPNQRPRSESVSFAADWANERLSPVQIKSVTDRMDGSTQT